MAELDDTPQTALVPFDAPGLVPAGDTTRELNVTPIEELLPEFAGDDYRRARTFDVLRGKVKAQYEHSDGWYLRELRHELTDGPLAGSGAWTRYLIARGIPPTTAYKRIAIAEGRPYPRYESKPSLSPGESAPSLESPVGAEPGDEEAGDPMPIERGDWDMDGEETSEPYAPIPAPWGVHAATLPDEVMKSTVAQSMKGAILVDREQDPDVQADAMRHFRDNPDVPLKTHLDRARMRAAQQADKLPMPEAEPRTHYGDIWQLGPHRLLCYDSTDLAAVKRLMQGELADMVFTDPPYGVGYDGGSSLDPREELEGDERDSPVYSQGITVMLAVMKRNAPIYMCFAGGEAGKRVYAAVDAAGLTIRSEIIWYKNIQQGGKHSANYKQQHEPILYCHRRGVSPIPWHGETNEKSVWEINRSQNNDLHPTLKPIELAARAIKNSSDPKGDALVFDGFLGSGTTLLAAKTQGRRCYAVEKRPKYCDRTMARWEQLTGGTAFVVDNILES